LGSWDPGRARRPPLASGTVRARMTERRGQTAAEYLGVLLVVSVIIATIAQSDLPGKLRTAVRQQICVAFNDASTCPDAVDSARDRARQRAAQRAATKDSDHDGIPDAVELRYGTDPHSRDSDGDGLDDGQEFALGSNPRKRDSDGDGVSDYDEYRQGTDPTKRVLPLTKDNALTPWVRVGMTKDQWEEFSKSVLDQANPHGWKGFVFGKPYVAVNLDKDGHVKLIQLTEDGINPALVLRALGLAGEEAGEATILGALTKVPAAVRGALAARGVIPAAIKFEPPPPPPVSPGIALNELDELGRATGAAATIDQAMLRTGSDVSQTVKVAGYGGRAAEQGRGHLIAKVLGGSGRDARNLVPIYQNPVNTPIMRGFERQVLKAVENGETVHYQVTPIYRGAELSPRAITMQAEGSGGFNLRVTVLNVKP
jgi:hypothetical protein